MIRKSWKIAVLTTAGLVVPIAGAGAADASGRSADPAVVTQWNAIAVRTITTQNATPVPASSLYYAFVSLAVYDAVVAIEGGYQPYRKQPRADRGASTEAAAATAAYETLNHYFPASAAALATDYAATLATIADGGRKTAGVRAGSAAAAGIIQARTDDGRGAGITLNVTPAPGVWRPTADNPASMLVPWLGFVRPLVLRSPTQIRLSGPDALTSSAYARDFAEVKAPRTAEQTGTALFWNANAIVQYQTAMRDQVTRRGYGIVRSARAFAMLSTSTADSLVGCWRAKYDNAFWRPITAIREADTDGNPATVADPMWTPLATTPPYPDYLSGHACLTGAATETMGHLFGRRSIDLDVASTVTGTTRHYDSTAALDAETMNARIWLGFHFRKAMTDGNRLGHESAGYVIRHEFQRR
jgi:hypothetical protein